MKDLDLLKVDLRKVVRDVEIRSFRQEAEIGNRVHLDSIQARLIELSLREYVVNFEAAMRLIIPTIAGLRRYFMQIRVPQKRLAAIRQVCQHPSACAD